MDTKKETLQELIEAKNKAGVLDFLLRGLKNKYKPNRAEYKITFETPKNYKSNYELIIKVDKIWLVIPNKSTAKNNSYSRSLNIDTKNFFDTLQLILVKYKTCKKYSSIVGYELPTTGRSKESLQQTAKSFEF